MSKNYRETLDEQLKDPAFSEEWEAQEAAIEQAKANLADLREREEDAIGGDALELLDSFLTPEEITASNLRVEKMIKSAKEK